MFHHCRIIRLARETCNRKQASLFASVPPMKNKVLTLTLGTNAIEPFTAIICECSEQDGVFVRGKPSLMLAGKARSLPKWSTFQFLPLGNALGLT